MNGSAGTILVVDDQPAIRQALKTTLSGLGFGVTEAASGEEALDLLSGRQFEVLLLDINMPGMGGMQACRELRRAAPGMAILMLTVREGQDEKVEALDAGADDYITKPFHIKELAARVRSSVRRVRAGAMSPGGTILIGDVELDPAKRMVRKSGKLIHVTPKEFDLLHYLMMQAGMPVTHARLLNAVWGPEYGSELEYLRTFVRQLRVKIEDEPANPTYLLTRAHVGYSFREPGTE